MHFIPHLLVLYMIITLSDFGRFEPELGVPSYMRGDLNVYIKTPHFHGFYTPPKLEIKLRIVIYPKNLLARH